MIRSQSRPRNTLISACFSAEQSGHLICLQEVATGTVLIRNGLAFTPAPFLVSGEQAGKERSR